MNDFVYKTSIPLERFRLADVLDAYGNWTFRAPLLFLSAYEGAQIMTDDQEFSCVEAYVKIPYLVARQSHVMVAFSYHHFNDKFMISLPRGMRFGVGLDQNINQAISEIERDLLSRDAVYYAHECVRQLREIFSELDLLPEHFKLAMSPEVARLRRKETIVDVLACHLTKQVDATFLFYGDEKLRPLHRFVVSKIVGDE